MIRIHWLVGGEGRKQGVTFSVRRIVTIIVLYRRHLIVHRRQCFLSFEFDPFYDMCFFYRCIVIGYYHLCISNNNNLYKLPHYFVFFYNNKNDTNK